MKALQIALLVLGLSFIVSCTDRKKEEAEMRERMETIEKIDSTVEEINSQIETDIEELEEALKELDSL